jgi:hypothetical protein
MEAAVITTAFVRNQWYRLAVGAAAVPLAGGFYLFMGVFWPSWWILLMALLPWQWISHRFGPALESMEVTREIPSRGPEASSSGWLRAVQLALVVVVVTQQLVSSGLKVERVPIFSWYDMYSSTYESPEHWAASRSPDYHLALLTDRGRTELPACDPYPAFVRAFERALEGSAEARERIWNALRACDEDLTDVRNVTLEGDMQIFDWNRLAFGASQTFTLGPLLAEAEAVTSAR